MRAKLLKAKRELLILIREGDEPCRRLFLDYRGLRLLHPWMGAFTTKDRLSELKFRLDFLQTLEVLPVSNKTTLHDSSVYQGVERWGIKTEYEELLREQIPSAVPAAESTSAHIDSGSGTPTSSDDVASPRPECNNSNGSVAVVPAPQEPKDDVQASVDLPTDANVTVAADITCASAAELSPINNPDASSQTTETTVDVQSASTETPVENDITVPACASLPIKSVSIANEENVQLPEVKSAENELKQLVDDVLQCCRKLMANWEQLPESFRIPKKQRLEQMKEHEREADQGCKQTVEEVTPHNAAFSTRFNERFGEREKERPIEVADSSSREKDPRQRSSRYKTFDSNYQKMQRRQMFEARVSGDQRF